MGTFLRTAFPNSRMVYDEHEPCATLDIDASLAQHLRRFIERRRLHNRVSEQFLVAMNEQRRLPFTFDDDYARQRPNLEFVTVRHPLTEAAREYWNEASLEGIPAGEVQVLGPVDEVGDGHFFIYLLEIRGISHVTSLEIVIVLDDGRFAPQSASRLLRHLQQGAIIPGNLDRNHDGFAAAQQAASRAMAGRRHVKEVEARRRNEALRASRTASIKTSFEAKLKRTETLLGEATDERIQRMRTSQVHNLRARMEAKIEELHRGKDVAGAYALVAGGRIRINAGQ